MDSGFQWPLAPITSPLPLSTLLARVGPTQFWPRPLPDEKADDQYDFTTVAAPLSLPARFFSLTEGHALFPPVVS